MEKVSIIGLDIAKSVFQAHGADATGASKSEAAQACGLSWLQGHAAWHLLGAIAVYFNYRYYCSEQPKAARQVGP